MGLWHVPRVSPYKSKKCVIKSALNEYLSGPLGPLNWYITQFIIYVGHSI